MSAGASHPVRNTTNLEDSMNRVAKMHRRLGHQTRKAMMATRGAVEGYVLSVDS